MLREALGKEDKEEWEEEELEWEWEEEEDLFEEDFLELGVRRLPCPAPRGVHAVVCSARDGVVDEVPVVVRRVRVNALPAVNTSL